MGVAGTKTTKCDHTSALTQLWSAGKTSLLQMAFHKLYNFKGGELHTIGIPGPKGIHVM